MYWAELGFDVFHVPRFDQKLNVSHSVEDGNEQRGKPTPLPGRFARSQPVVATRGGWEVAKKKESGTNEKAPEARACAEEKGVYSGVP